MQADDAGVGSKLGGVSVVDHAEHAGIALDAGKARGFGIGDSARAHNNGGDGDGGGYDCRGLGWEGQE